MERCNFFKESECDLIEKNFAEISYSSGARVFAGIAGTSSKTTHATLLYDFFEDVKKMFRKNFNDTIK